MNKIKVWTRIPHAHYDEWKLVASDSPAHIPASAMKTYNDVFWKMHTRGVLYPLDELAAYQNGMLAIIAATKALALGTVTLTSCSPTTYVIASGVMRLRQFRREEVTVAREQYRQLNDRCRDGGCDLQALAEALSDMGHAAVSQSRTLAAHCVADTLAHCSDETRFALGVYLENDLNASRTAKVLRLPFSTFVWRRDHRWFPDFRQHCLWRW